MDIPGGSRPDFPKHPPPVQIVSRSIFSATEKREPSKLGRRLDWTDFWEIPRPAIVKFFDGECVLFRDVIVLRFRVLIKKLM